MMTGCSWPAFSPRSPRRNPGAARHRFGASMNRTRRPVCRTAQSARSGMSRQDHRTRVRSGGPSPAGGPTSRRAAGVPWADRRGCGVGADSLPSRNENRSWPISLPILARVDGGRWARICCRGCCGAASVATRCTRRAARPPITTLAAGMWLVRPRSWWLRPDDRRLRTRRGPHQRSHADPAGLDRVSQS